MCVCVKILMKSTFYIVTLKETESMHLPNHSTMDRMGYTDSFQAVLILSFLSPRLFVVPKLKSTINPIIFPYLSVKKRLLLVRVLTAIIYIYIYIYYNSVGCH